MQSNFSYSLTFWKRIRPFILKVCNLSGLVSQMKCILSPFYRKEKKMKKIESKSLNNQEEVRTFDKGKLELVKIGGATIGRATFMPGWR